MRRRENWGTWPGEKPLGAKEKTNDKLNPHMTLTPDMNPAHIGKGRGGVSALKGQGVINSKVTSISSLLCVL